MRYLFDKTTTNIIIATNPITYILILLVLIYSPFYFIWKLLKLHDIWFILFKLNKLDEFELHNVESALNRRVEKNNYKKRYIKWYSKNVDKWALKKITNKNK